MARARSLLFHNICIATGHHQKAHLIIELTLVFKTPENLTPKLRISLSTSDHLLIADVNAPSDLLQVLLQVIVGSSKAVALHSEVMHLCVLLQHLLLQLQLCVL